MKSSSLLQTFVEALTLEIREQEQINAENRTFAKLEMNELNAFVESMDSLGPEPGKKFFLTIVINQKPYKGTFEISKKDAMDINYPFDQRMMDAVKGVVTEAIFSAVKLDFMRYK